ELLREVAGTVGADPAVAIGRRVAGPQHVGRIVVREPRPARLAVVVIPVWTGSTVFRPLVACPSQVSLLALSPPVVRGHHAFTGRVRWPSGPTSETDPRAGYSVRRSLVPPSAGLTVRELIRHAAAASPWLNTAAELHLRGTSVLVKTRAPSPAPYFTTRRPAPFRTAAALPGPECGMAVAKGSPWSGFERSDFNGAQPPPPAWRQRNPRSDGAGRSPECVLPRRAESAVRRRDVG